MNIMVCLSSAKGLKQKVPRRRNGSNIQHLLLKRGLTDPLFSDLGQFSKEEDYVAGKFLGAKRYLAEYPDGSIHATIAGLPKDAILKLPAGTDPFDYFSIDGMYIDAEISGKLGSS